MMRNDSEFNQLIRENHNKPVLVDFTATWCGPCKAIAPVFDALSKSYPGIIFVKVDVDMMSETASKFSVTAMPTFHVVLAEKSVDMIRGANEGQLRALCEKYKSVSPFPEGGNRLGGKTE